MSLHYAIRGTSRNFKAFGSTYCNLPLKNSSRSLWSSPLYKPRQVSREVKRSGKQVYKRNADAKVYMRDVVREISNILRYSSWDSAHEQLERLSIKWDSFTVNQVLKTHPPMEKAWLFFNWADKLKGFKHDQFTYTTMLDIFGEARRISSMKYIFNQMQEKGIKIDAVTYTSLLHWVSDSGDFDGAVKIWEEMKAKRCHPTVVTYTTYMKVLFDNDRAEEATKVYKEMIQCGLSPTCHTYTVLMTHLIRTGKTKSALEVFRKMQEAGVQPDKATCNILVEKCSEAGEIWAIFQILHYMKENSLVLRYPVYLQAHETLKMAGESDMLLRQVNPHICVKVFDKNDVMEPEETSSNLNSTIDRGLLMEFLRKKNFIAVDRLLAGILNHNSKLDPGIVSKIIEANCAHGRIDAALKAIEFSNKLGIHLEHVTYLSILGLLIRANEFSKILQIVEQMVKFGLFNDPQLGPTLIYRLGQARELDIAVKIFDLLPGERKNTTIYTALIDACFSAGDPVKGIETFRTMKSRGVRVASGTYNVLIRGLEKSGRFDEAKFYWKEKRSLQREHHVSESVFVEEKICDVLFAGYMV